MYSRASNKSKKVALLAARTLLTRQEEIMENPLRPATAEDARYRDQLKAELIAIQKEAGPPQFRNAMAKLATMERCTHAFSNLYKSRYEAQFITELKVTPDWSAPDTSTGVVSTMGISHPKSQTSKSCQIRQPQPNCSKLGHSKGTVTHQP